jgi:hypothetical protein
LTRLLNPTGVAARAGSLLLLRLDDDEGAPGGFLYSLLLAAFGEQLPDLEIRIWPDAGNLADIVSRHALALPICLSRSTMSSAVAGS